MLLIQYIWVPSKKEKHLNDPECQTLYACILLDPKILGHILCRHYGVTQIVPYTVFLGCQGLF